MPTKFQIYVDQGAKANATATNRGDIAATTAQPDSERPKFVPYGLATNQRLYFDERKLYPIKGGEYSFEEINYACWLKRQRELGEKMRMMELQRENEFLRQKVESLEVQISLLQKQMREVKMGPPSPTSTVPLHPPTSNRLSIVPQSLQPTQGLEYNDQSCHYGAFNEVTSVVHDCWKNTGTVSIPISTAHTNSDKFTLPINNSQWMRDNASASTPNFKREEDKRTALNNRRMSRPSMGGSPTLKLSPITETSREGNSKSSSSSSAMSATPGTIKKQPLVMNTMQNDEPDRPLDPNDPTTYRQLLRGLSESLDRRSGYFRLNRSVPKIRQGACFQAGPDSYLVDKELSQEAKMFTAQLLTDDDSSADIPIKTICFRVDQPANEWLYYICNELHRRLVKQKTKPDIELSVMIANPAIMYNDGSILVDEYFRFISLQDFFEACSELSKPFPRSVAAYITLELIQLVRQMHTCDIIHMNINPKNILITCCPTRDDITNVGERTSIVKLIGFDRAMDTRLLPEGFKFDGKLNDLEICEMLDSKPWSIHVDWFGALNCIHKMFFLDDMSVSKDDEGRWTIGKQFKGFPTNVWSYLFDELLNITDIESLNKVIEQAVDELNTWIKANISFVLKEADGLDRVLEEHCKNSNKSIRT